MPDSFFGICNQSVIGILRQAADLTEDATHRFATDTEKAGWNDKYTRAESDSKDAATLNTAQQHTLAQIAILTGNAPANLNTLGKLAQAINNDPQFAQTITNLINGKAPLAHTHAASQVAEEADKRFMTDAERNKLSGIAANANNYAHPASHPAGMIDQSADRRFVTDAEKADWNSKAPGVPAPGYAYETCLEFQNPVVNDAFLDALPIRGKTLVNDPTTSSPYLMFWKGTWLFLKPYSHIIISYDMPMPGDFGYVIKKKKIQDYGNLINMLILFCLPIKITKS